MSGDVNIETARESDLPAIKRLLLELMDAIEDTEGFDIEQSVENCRIMLNYPGHYMLLARDNDNLLGFVNFTTRRVIMHPNPSGLIDELVVTRASRGSGIGRKLMLAAIDKCRQLGCGEVEVSTEKINKNAREFYKALGFEEDAVLLEIDLED
jgi:GNAT superfamily N-acetyltransferase